MTSSRHCWRRRAATSTSTRTRSWTSSWAVGCGRPRSTSTRLKALWTEFGDEVAAAEEKLAQPGPVERTLEVLLAEARAWLAQQSET